MRMRKRRILPATWPSTSCPLSSCTRNMAFGSASTTSPSNSTLSSFAKLNDPDVRGLWALRALAELEIDLRTFGQRPEAIPRDPGEMDERVLASVIGRDEAETLLVAEPLHDTSSHLTALLLDPACARGAAGTAFPHTTMTAPGGPDGASCTSPERLRLAVVGRLRAAARIGLRRRLVRVGIERRVVVGGRLLVVAALGVVARRRLRARRDARSVRIDLLAVLALGVVLAALTRVV